MSSRRKGKKEVSSIVERTHKIWGAGLRYAQKRRAGVSFRLEEVEWEERWNWGERVSSTHIRRES